MKMSMLGCGLLVYSTIYAWAVAGAHGFMRLGTDSKSPLVPW